MRAAHRLPISIAASAVVHAAVAMLVLGLATSELRPALVVFPVSLVASVGGGGGGPDAHEPPGPPAGTPATEAQSPPEPVSTPAAPALRPRTHVARRVEEPPPAPPSARPAEPGAGAAPAGADETGGGAGGSGGGDGSGGDGSGGAGAAYGTNPRPPYPLVARRLGIEGVVLLEVVVAADGRAADVRVARSSGFAPLDESALRTVREQWRFVPARRGGAAVETTVTVPIRFRLDGARG